MVPRDNYNTKSGSQPRTEHTHYLVNKHILGSLFLLLWQITIKPKIELNNFHIFVHKMIKQSLKLRKFLTDQVVNMLGHVWWLSIISTPDIYPQPPFLEFFKDSSILMKGGREWLVCSPPCYQCKACLAWFS